MALLPTRAVRVRAAATVGEDSSGSIGARMGDQSNKAIDALLQFLNVAFKQVGASLTILLATTFNGAVSVAGTLTVLGTTALQALTATTGAFSGALTGTSASFSGGVLKGSRHAPFKAFLPGTALNGGAGAQQFSIIVPTAAATSALTGTFYLPPYAGSIAAFSVKVYNAVSTGGFITITSSGATANINVVVTAAQANATFTTTFAPGAFPYTAGAVMTFYASSSAGWSQGANAGIEFQAWVYE